MLIGFVALSAEVAHALSFQNAAVFLRCVSSGLFIQRTLKRGLFWQDAVPLVGTAIGTINTSSTLYLNILKWLFVSIGALLGAALPPEHAKLMRARGTLAVGTRDGVWSKNRRNQHFRVWFPCVAPTGSKVRPTPYFAADVPHAVGMAKFAKMPTWLFRHLALTDTGTFADAVPLNGRLPLVIFSHGLGGVRSTYSSMCADFASFGYTVVALEHQDETASVTVDPAGNVLWYKMPTPEQIADNDNFVMRHRQLMHRREEIADFLAELRNDDDDNSDVDEAVRVVRRASDVSRVHLAGHSFGGATTIDCVAALRSHGVLSGCALDSWMHPLGERERKAKLAVPTIMLNTDLFQWRENVALMQTLAENAAAPCVVGFVPSTGHQSVSDFPQFLRIGTRLLKHAGPIDPEVALSVFSDAAMAVFRFAERADADADDAHFAAQLGADVTIQFQSTHH